MSGQVSWQQSLYRSAFPYLVSDIVATVAAYYLTLYLRIYSEWGGHFFTWLNRFLEVRDTGSLGVPLAAFYIFSAPRILFILTATLTFLYAFVDLYAVRRFIRRRHEGANVVVANLLALALIYVYFYLSRNQFHPRSMFGVMLVFNAGLCLAFRAVMRRALQRSGLIRCPSVLIGETIEADVLADFVQVREPQGLGVAARMAFDPSEPMDAFLSRLRSLVECYDTRMILCADRRMSVAQIMQVLETAGELGQEVKILSDKFNVLVGEAAIQADYFLEMPLVHFSVPACSGPGFRLRRAAGVAVGAVGLAIAAPFMLVMMALIKLTSPGPAFFVQERIGIDRRPFRMFKFRTMYHRAEELVAQMEEFNESGEGLFKMRKDPRVTPVGRFLRRFSLDELPQLLNVVKGEMSIVGPRPLPRRDYANYYEEWHYSRHSGLPGLTCLWQVSGRSDVSFHNMCILDDYYLRNQGVMLDLKIILRTIGVVLFAKGAY
jgi:exopolysaccharide biosynthesis polyprenyl glycosylphosphotransferase